MTFAIPPSSPGPRGRYAPSPTGLIHVGNARTALAAWLSARAGGGTFVWRLEDLDGPRVIPGMADAAVEDLAWLGIDWDEGPDTGGPFEPYRQSERFDFYEDALEHLASSGRTFPCRVSRKDLLELSSAPHGSSGLPPYPASLRPSELEPGWFERLRANPEPNAAIRFRVDSRPTVFEDRVYGRMEERIDLTTGDFVLKRRDGFYAYQLAVVVDDLLMGINEIVRGADLLDSTARQIQLIEGLGGTPPTYAHVPLVVNSRGEKLSKRDAGLDLRALRQYGVKPEQVAGFLGYSLGLLDRPIPIHPSDLIGSFDWSRVPKHELMLPNDLPWRLKQLR